MDEKIEQKKKNLWDDIRDQISDHGYALITEESHILRKDIHETINENQYPWYHIAYYDSKKPTQKRM